MKIVDITYKKKFQYLSKKVLAPGIEPGPPEEKIDQQQQNSNFDDKNG